MINKLNGKALEEAIKKEKIRREEVRRLEEIKKSQAVHIIPKRYKLVCSNKDGSFTIREDEIEKLMEASKKNQPAIFNEGIVLNWNMYSGVVPDRERNHEIFEANKHDSKFEEPSPFAKLLSPKMTMLSGRNKNLTD